MKTTTVLKILNRYKKGLAFMEQESLQSEEKVDAEHYKIDRLAIEQAIECVERSNTLS